MRAAIIVLALGACASEASFDAKTCGAPTVLRIDGVTLPRNNTEARDFAMDLDDNDRVDNQLGMVLGTLEGQIGNAMFSTTASKRLAAEPMWFASVRTCGDGTAAGTLTPTSDVGDALQMTGDVDGEGFVVDGQGAAIPMSTLFDLTSVFPSAGYVRSKRAVLEVHPIGGGRWEGRVAMGVDGVQTIRAVGDVMVPYFNEHRLFIGSFDRTPFDGTISMEEFESNSLVQSLLAEDLGRHHDQGLSAGFGISAAEVQ